MLDRLLLSRLLQHLVFLNATFCHSLSIVFLCKHARQTDALLSFAGSCVFKQTFTVHGQRFESYRDQL